MPSVQNTGGTQNTDCGPRDVTAPPTPTVHRMRAFERGSDRASIVRNRPAGRRVFGGDPTYIELRNVEPGTKIQLINLSKKPDGSFEDEDAIVELKLTGRDVRGRQAAFYLTDAQMEAIDLKPGDILRLRAVDAAGNTSAEVTNELEPDDWGNQNVRDVENGSWVTSRGTTESMLDGEGVRKNVIIKTVNDGRAPLLLEDKLSFAHVSFSADEKAQLKTLTDNWNDISAKIGGGAWTQQQCKEHAANADLPDAVRKAFGAIAKSDDLFARLDKINTQDKLVGHSDFTRAQNHQRVVVLEADLAIEPNSRVRVHNARLGKATDAQVGADQKLRIALPDYLDGDTVLVTPFDNENHEGKTLEFLMSADCDRGIAPKLDVLGARLPGVI